jgi:hypothetical protein
VPVIEAAALKTSSTKSSNKLKVHSTIVEFRECSPESAASLPYATHVVQTALRLSTSQLSFFEMVVKNRQASLRALLVIDHDFPRVAPLFAINIQWKEQDRNFLNDEAVRVWLFSIIFFAFRKKCFNVLVFF